MLVAGPPPTPDEGGDQDPVVRRAMLANTAAALELPWPRCVRKKSGGGRPTLDAQYEDALYDFLQAYVSAAMAGEDLGLLPSPQRPQWWRPSMSVQPGEAVDDVDEDAAGNGPRDPVAPLAGEEGDGEEGDGEGGDDEEGGAEPPVKRAYIRPTSDPQEAPERPRDGRGAEN